MKKLPTIINQCSECPFCHIWNLNGGLKCEHVQSPNAYVYSMNSEGKVPKWCPLEGADPVKEWAKKGAEMGQKMRQEGCPRTLHHNGEIHLCLREMGHEQDGHLFEIADEVEARTRANDKALALLEAIKRTSMQMRKDFGTRDIITQYMRNGGRI